MKTNLYTLTAACCLTLWAASGCSQSEELPAAGEDRPLMEFNVCHPSQQTSTRITDTAFEDGDKIGVFITEANELLEPSGNYVNNAALNFNSTQWTPDQPIYWNPGTYQVYAYYPFTQSVSSIDDYPFSLATDQSTPAGYAQSDFLWAQSPKVTASNHAVDLSFKHRMSRILIKLVKGEDYEGDLPATAEVFIHNTVTQATIDLSAGIATRNPYASAKSIRAKQLGNNLYTAIVVPQRLDNRLPLVEVIMNGVSYLYESRFLFKPGIQHAVQLVVSKNPDQIKIEIGGELENWT